MTKACRPLLAALLFAAAAFPSRAAAQVLRFDTAELTLLANAVYDARGGAPNPFDVTLTATVTAPSGRILAVDGFFDGDGAGAAVGRAWKVRIFADEPGTWTWRTTSSLPELAGKSGSFPCQGTLGGVFAAGPVVVLPSRPRSFSYRNDGAVYLLGKFLDVAAPARLRFSHTLLSEQLTDADRQAMLDRHRGMSLNKMNVYLANRGDYGGVATTPWVGTAAANDKRRFDLARWQTYDRWVRRLRDAGLVAQLWFFADDSGFGDLPEADRERLIRYGMARLSGYANTFFTLALEWQEGWSAAEVVTGAGQIHRWNPWDRLVSVHGLTGDFSFPTALWADYLDLQAGNDAGHATVHTAGLRNRALAVKPLIQEEHGMGEEDQANRQKAWAAFMAGAAGSGTGAFLKHLAAFVATVPFDRMQPSGALVLSGSAYVLAEAGQVYAAYLPGGGTVRLDLRGVSGTLEAHWFDPRLGTFQSGQLFAGGTTRDFTAPGSGDWALRVRRTGAAPPPPPVQPARFFTLTPCRVYDSRLAGLRQPLRNGETRRVPAAGVCGIPATARALAVNVTAVSPSGALSLAIWPSTLSRAQANVLSFAPYRTRGNNTFLMFGGGELSLEAGVVGTVHVALDVNGYFQ